MNDDTMVGLALQFLRIAIDLDSAVRALGSAKKDCECSRKKTATSPRAKPARDRRSDRPNDARGKAAPNRQARRGKIEAVQAMPNDAPTMPWWRESLEAYGRPNEALQANLLHPNARVRKLAASIAARPKQLTLDLHGKAPRKSPGNRRANQGPLPSRKPARGSKRGQSDQVVARKRGK